MREGAERVGTRVRGQGCLRDDLTRLDPVGCDTQIGETSRETEVGVHRRVGIQFVEALFGGELDQDAVRHLHPVEVADGLGKRTEPIRHGVGQGGAAGGATEAADQSGSGDARVSHASCRRGRAAGTEIRNREGGVLQHGVAADLRLREPELGQQGAVRGLERGPRLDPLRECVGDTRDEVLHRAAQQQVGFKSHGARGVLPNGVAEVTMVVVVEDAQGRPRRTRAREGRDEVHGEPRGRTQRLRGVEDLSPTDADHRIGPVAFGSRAETFDLSGRALAAERDLDGARGQAAQRRRGRGTGAASGQDERSPGSVGDDALEQRRDGTLTVDDDLRCGAKTDGAHDATPNRATARRSVSSSCTSPSRTKPVPRGPKPLPGARATP